ncbi:TonB-dependent receptor [Segetibacter sp. 3557_3]|uniref:TonB-dependent receptor n=1 Tax=Segetibacter sp. 3557_3 TaxID=2547429 RepID=UPI001059145D|nr:TonB-dependent receptor [Segetibacter sp. 3557_3]TDH28015.1 TonB-dependent receptor [Segetibacter sp. 3557_3]
MKFTTLFLVLLFPILSNAQVIDTANNQTNNPVINATITGKVVSSRTNELLAGASVSIKGTTNGSTTNAGGEFALITGQKLPFTLIVSFLGYTRKELVISESKVTIKLDENSAELGGVVVTSRRREESVQDIPIPISVVSGAKAEEAGAFNVNRLKELIPSVQLYSSNPRNTGINIRGLGSPFGLTNDGLDPGVGFYVDGVYFARPAATTLDFIDVERIEVLRGPQGTLFGKNTTSGAFNITTRKPSFNPGGNFELSYGNYSYVQAKASITGPLSKKFAGRISFSGTNRNGLIQNIATDKATNTINNFGIRGQLLYKPSEKTALTLVVDNTRQRPDGYAQVVAGVAETKRPAYRQFNAIIADLNYKLPSLNPFDRVIDHDSPWNSGNDLGGASLNVDIKLGPGTLTSTTAWRYWKWDPSNDRDFTGLQSLRKSNNYSKQDQLSQEIRYSGEISSRVSGVVGLYAINQEVQSDPVTIEEAGTATWRFQQSSTSALWKTPGLFEGFGIRTRQSIKSLSAAAFANVDWEIAKGLHVLPGLRFNLDKKDVVYDRTTYGGLDTARYNGSQADKVALQGFKEAVYSNQAYNADANENNLTYQLTLAYRPNKHINAFATYSTSFKPIGVNVAGLPVVNGAPALELAVIKPEYLKHYEIGIKSNPSEQLTLNLVLHNSDIKNYQANVQSAQLGVNRGYIANAEKVNVKGLEFDGSFRANRHFSFNGALAYTEGTYVQFTNAPLPLEQTGATENGVQKAFKDISGGVLPGISKWSGSLGGEFIKPVTIWENNANFFIALDSYFRSRFSSSPSPSSVLNIDGYALVNARLGFRASKGLSAFIWSRNLLDKNYFEQLLPAGGNAGHYAGVLGDQRTYGVTMRYSL